MSKRGNKELLMDITEAIDRIRNLHQGIKL